MNGGTGNDIASYSTAADAVNGEPGYGRGTEHGWGGKL